MADGNTVTKIQDPQNPKRALKKKHVPKKRMPFRPNDGNNVIFIKRKASYKAQLERCSDLINKGEKEIILHGLGSAIARCCNLALQLVESFSDTCQIEVNTGTADILDDLEPDTDDVVFDTQVRRSSSVHIRIFRTSLLEAKQ